ncbi:hypothetical protein NX059_008926 [Plenodomus lindquistii]|nr:hypothetical protein NX059_008926 [Plenodomus lindquistii]
MTAQLVIRNIPIRLDGDALLVQVNPTVAPRVHNNINYENHFRVDSKVLAKSSAYFKTLIDGPFQKLTFWEDGLLHFTVDEDLNTTAMMILLHALHGETIPLSHGGGLDMLIQMIRCMDIMTIDSNAIAAAYQVWQQSLGLKQASCNWTTRLINAGKPGVAPCNNVLEIEDDLKRLLVYMWFDADMFALHASRLVKYLTAPLVCPARLRNLPMVSALVDRINERRSHLIKAEFNRIPAVRARLQQGGFHGCSASCVCGAQILAHVNFHLAPHPMVGRDLRAMLAMPGPNYVGLQFSKAYERVANVLWSAYPATACHCPAYNWLPLYPGQFIHSPCWHTWMALTEYEYGGNWFAVLDHLGDVTLLSLDDFPGCQAGHCQSRSVKLADSEWLTAATHERFYGRK